MTRFEYTENVRCLGIEMRRSPVDAALSGIMALGEDDLSELQTRLADIATKSTGRRITLNLDTTQ